VYDGIRPHEANAVPEVAAQLEPVELLRGRGRRGGASGDVLVRGAALQHVADVAVAEGLVAETVEAGRRHLGEAHPVRLVAALQREEGAKGPRSVSSANSSVPAQNYGDHSSSERKIMRSCLLSRLSRSAVLRCSVMQSHDLQCEEGPSIEEEHAVARPELGRRRHSPEHS
jgi:hypothetical protein